MMPTAASRALAVPLKALVSAYQAALSPWLGMRCRFQPTCSAYALEALETHGAFSRSGTRRAPHAALPSLGRFGLRPGAARGRS